MITDSDVQRLRTIHTRQRSVLSLYLRVPADPAGLRELPARARGMLTLAAGHGSERGSESSGQGKKLVAEDERLARELIEQNGRDWLGHTAAIFIAEPGSVREVYALPCALPDRAVLADRPHLRPLLVAQQRCPAHYVLIVDRVHAWLFRVSGEQIETTAALTQPDQVLSTSYGGWYGLDSYKVNQSVMDLVGQHLQGAADLAGRMAGTGTDGDPLVVGGHAETMARFIGMLPAGLRERLAGTFAVDPHSMTPAKVRALAAPVIESWVGLHEQQRAVQIRAAEGPHDPLTLTGLSRCLDAVNQHAVDLLVVPVGGVIDGFVCEACGELGAAVTGCPDGPAESRWVPDLFEEMVAKTLDDGGRTEALSEPPGDVAAQLRFPVVAPSVG